MILKKNLDIEKKSARVLGLFLFQYSFLIPLMMYYPSAMLVAVSGVLLLAVMLAVNIKRCGNILPLAIFFAVLLVVLVKIIIYDSRITALVTYVSICLPAAIVCLYGIDYNEFIDYVAKLSVANFFVIFWYPFVRIDYMRFGYGILLSCMGLYIYLFEKGNLRRISFKSVCYAIVFLLSCLELVLYGARGATLSFALLVISDYLLIRRDYKKMILLAFAMIFFVLNVETVIQLLEKITYKIGIGSRAIMKYKLFLNGGTIDEILSGRVEIYKNSLKKFYEHPILGGSIDFTGVEYSHNIFLEVMMDLGVCGVFVLICFLINIIITMLNGKKDLNCRIIYNILFSLAIGRLMFSSTIWLRPEFWVLIYFFFSQEYNRIRFVFKFK